MPHSCIHGSVTYQGWTCSYMLSCSLQCILSFVLLMCQQKPACVCLCLTMYHSKRGAHGSIVVKALCYKLEGRGFETR
jgi:hypothetical protein